MNRPNSDLRSGPMIRTRVCKKWKGANQWCSGTHYIYSQIRAVKSEPLSRHRNNFFILSHSPLLRCISFFFVYCFFDFVFWFEVYIDLWFVCWKIARSIVGVSYNIERSWYIVHILRAVYSASSQTTAEMDPQIHGLFMLFLY